MAEAMAQKRRCKHPGCGTILRQTNTGEYCSVHEYEAEEPELHHAFDGAELPVSLYYTVAQAAKILNYSTRAIRDKTAKGELASKRIGPRGKLLIPRSEIEALPSGQTATIGSASHTKLSDAAEQDPEVFAAKMRHVDHLLALVSRWENGLQEVPATVLAFLMLIRESPLQPNRVFCPSADFADIAAQKGGQVQQMYESIQRSPLGLTYSPSDPNRLVTVRPVIEDDPLFHSLQSHLSSQQYKPVWQAWEDLKRNVQEKANSIAKTISAGGFPPSPVLGRADTDSPEWRGIREWLRASPSRLQHSLQQICLMGRMPGRCDICPEEAAVAGSRDEVV
jgi:excisionase family DNA binding protein